MMTLFDDDEIMKAYTRDIKETTARETAKETARETAKRMIKDGELSLEKIACYVPALTIEELRKIEAEAMQLA